MNIEREDRKEYKENTEKWMREYWKWDYKINSIKLNQNQLKSLYLIHIL